MGLSWVHILLFGAVALLLFGGRGKISDMMGDLGKGISSFRKGLANSDDHPSDPVDKKDTAAKP